MNYHNITCPDLLNGDGLRVVLWVAGCECHCKGCQNPETWDFNSGIPFDDNAKQEIIDKLSLSYIQGLTLTGGHPLDGKNCNDSFYWFIKEIKHMFPNKDIWCYTGWTWEQLSDHDCAWDLVRECVDVLVDGPYIESLRDTTLPWRGSKNQRVIDVKKTLQEERIIMYETRN